MTFNDVVTNSQESMAVKGTQRISAACVFQQILPPHHL